MKQSKTARTAGIGALELIEEATALLRGTPVEVLARYYLGTLPFTLGALYFWADMSRNADAAARLAGSSLALALLFGWMKYWQARFCGELSRLLQNGAAAPPASGTALAQTIIQPWSFLVIPLALLVSLPFGWCFAFFQNVTAIGGSSDLRRTFRTAREQAMLWPGQNHILLGIFLLLALVVFANLCLGAYFLPRVLKTLVGVESIFTRSNLHLLNSTFWVAMAALTHLCVDPLVKAAYLLRCHYGASLASGADLLAELQEARRSSGRGLTLLLLATGLFLATGPPAQAATAPEPTALRATVSAQQLDKTIEQVIAEPEFAWRLPRPAQERGEMPGFIRSALELLQEWAAGIGAGFKRFLEWLADILPKFKPKDEGAAKGFGFPDYAFPLLYGLLAVILAGGGVLCWSQFRRGRETTDAAPPTATVVTPDVGDENVTADELSAERWQDLARELLAKGELRLGLRALYLAGLACLAQERLIAIARFKSNRDYERELGRFAHALPEVATAFAGNVALFEQAWYGMHRLEQETITTFISNHERIVSGVRQG